MDNKQPRPDDEYDTFGNTFKQDVLAWVGTACVVTALALIVMLLRGCGFFEALQLLYLI